MRCAGLLVVALSGACAGAEAMTPPPPAPTAPEAAAGTEPVGLNPGETMAFEVHLAGILAGEAQLAVGAVGDYEGHRAVVVKSRAATAGAAALIRRIADEATTVIDFDTGRPLALETVVERGDRRTTATAKFTDSVADITYTRSDEKQPRTLRIDLTKGPGTTGAFMVHDAHSAMAQLRSWRAAAGARRAVFLIGGRRMWRVDMTHAGNETIGSALGNRRAIKFTGESYRVRRDFAAETAKPSRTFSVWLSDDADRVPLKVTASTELGDIVMDLTEYSRPAPDR
jgi:hypothetical protein